MHAVAAWVTIIGQNVVVTFRNSKYTLPRKCAATCSLVYSNRAYFCLYQPGMLLQGTVFVSETYVVKTVEISIFVL